MNTAIGIGMIVIIFCYHINSHQDVYRCNKIFIIETLICLIENIQHNIQILALCVGEYLTLKRHLKFNDWTQTPLSSIIKFNSYSPKLWQLNVNFKLLSMLLEYDYIIQNLQTHEALRVLLGELCLLFQQEL